MKKRTLDLQDRDYKVLTALEKWGVLGLGQLYGITVETGADLRSRVARYFNKADARDYGRWFAQRLTALGQAGYIADHFFLNHPKIFTLAERGHKELQLKKMALLKGFRGSISGELVAHEVHVAAVGLVLSEVFHHKVRTERERYIWTGKGGRSPAPVRAVSDLWIVEPRPKAVEVELSQKSEARYKELWEAYSLKLQHNGAVLYLTGWPDGVRCILNYARQFRAPFIYAAGLDDFQTNCGRTPFAGARDGESIVIEPATAVPEAGAAPRRVSPPSLPARPDFVGPGGRLGIEPFAAPSQPARVGTLTPPQERRGQSVPPPASRACPRPLPLYSPSPSPEGEIGGINQ